MRARTNVARHKRRRRLLKQAKGFRGTPKNRLRRAKDSVQRAMNYAYDGRKQKKREYRALFITRINAACRPLGVKYSELVHLLLKAGIALDRRSLADLAVNDPPAFTKVVAAARAAK
jgi:large subunit ribosomal protein L20